MSPQPHTPQQRNDIALLPAGYYRIKRNGRTIVARWLPSLDRFVTARGEPFTVLPPDEVVDKVS